ncbi:Lin1 family protein [Drechmeria coniospora]|uniref:Lin1 family protein n=1 Tax=Drechmeria coniospora TaxID=98403 RepID=A0A151GF86_DRECN|nr:Lin1 family protein [Drechmeria coniospora]KYK55759.1 Lin1 family protein [Drechmeria coniospora]
MASRYSAARPKRDGENFARTHHNEDEPDNKRVKFDVRNPSTLAAEAREDDAVLDADVIGGSGVTKRGAVNLDGYDSDSDNETFNTRAASRKKGDVNILEQLDNYNAASGGALGENGKAGSLESGEGKDEQDDDEDEDMFATVDEAPAKEADPESGDFDKSGRKQKAVRFLDASEIGGQVEESKSGGRVRLDENESSDDDSDAELAIQEEGLDEEVGAGGLKRNAPKVEAFNLREEMEEGQFDQAGNFVRKAGDPDAVHDSWLQGLSKKDLKKAAEAHRRREGEARKQRLEEDDVLVSDLLTMLILQLERVETPLEALARLGKKQTKAKKIPMWKRKKMSKAAEDIEVDADAVGDAEQVRIKESINAITDAADKLLSRDFDDVYEQERELLIRAFQRETGEDWLEPEAKRGDDDQTGNETADGSKTWEFRWTDGRDGATQGPFDEAMMKAWQDAGYFGQGVEFRPTDGSDAWSSTMSFV